MTASLFLQSIVERLEDIIERVQFLAKDLDERQLNHKPDAKSYSMAQIFEHMLLGSEAYIPLMRNGISGRLKSPADPEAYHSWFGRFVIKAAGPSGNAPVPKKLVPGPGPYRSDLVDRWIARHQDIQALAKQSRGFDLSAIPMRSPLMPLFKMNLADFFEILTAHAERHVGQIERLARSHSKSSEKQPAGV